MMIKKWNINRSKINRSKINRYWWVGILIVAILTLGALDYDRGYNSALYNDFSGGINSFTDPANLQDNQAINIENFLFYGNRLRPRKSITDLNSTSLGSEGIAWVIFYEKEDWSEILVAYDGYLWYYDVDSSEFIYRVARRDTTWEFIVSGDTTELIGLGSTDFTSLGYRDSVPIVINDTTYYILSIFSDTVAYLSQPWSASVDTDTVYIETYFHVSKDRPVSSDVWLGNVYIAGSDGVIEYDGNKITEDTFVDTFYVLSASPTWDSVKCQIRLYLGSAFPYNYNELRGKYIGAYKDTVSGNLLNIPLWIDYNDSRWVYADCDSYWVKDAHIADGLSFKLLFNIDQADTVDTIIVDSVVILSYQNYVWPGGYSWRIHNYEIYDTSKTDSAGATYEVTDLNYNHYRLFSGRWNSNRHSVEPVRLREDANNLLYFYGIARLTDGMEEDSIAVGDTLYLMRYTEGTGIADEAIPSLITHWQDRQWRAGYPDDPNLLKWSESFDPDSFPSLYYAYIVRDDGDILTAVHVMSFQDILLLFKYKHIYAMYTSGEGPYDFPILDLVDGIGTPSWASIISYGRKVYFYDYTGFYEFDGSTPQKISWQIENIIADSINKDYAHLIVGGYFDQHLWWSYPSGTATKNNRTILYNLEDQAWTTTDINASAYFVGQIETDSNGVLIGDPDSGKVYRYGLNYIDHGNDSIDATYESPWFDCGDEYDLQKRFKDIQFVMSRGDSTIVYIDYYKDYVNTVIWTDTVAVDTFSYAYYYKRAIQFGNVRGQRIKLRIRVINIDADFSLAFFRIKWKPVGEVRYNDD